jgi:phosphatidylserine synthase
MDLTLASQAGWLLLVAAIISVTYELWRATAHAGVSSNDSMSGWLQGLPIYVVAVAVSVLLIVGWEWAPIAGLVVSGASCLASIFWYGPTILPPRQPGLVDWIEDRVFTMLVAIVFVLLVYDVLGATLRPLGG